MSYQKIACIADDSKAAQVAQKQLAKRYDFVKRVADADVLIVLGGDGFMLHSLHNNLKYDVPIFGMNLGSVGFLMNSYNKKDLLKRLQKTEETVFHPLHMVTKSCKGKVKEAIAFNEVSLLRETRQAANLKISVDGKVRIKEMISDGVLLSTPAGSTAYNFSAQGPILPLGSDILALTPISPFRPRRWKGALLPHRAVVEVEVIDPKKRPVSAVADFTEVRDVCYVKICEDRSRRVRLLFDKDHSLEERIIGEQFVV